MGIRVEALAEGARADAVEEAFFRHSTTLGVRRWIAGRVTLARRTIDVPAGDGTTVRVKLSEAPNGISAKPEYDDIIELAERSGRSAHTLARELQEAAIRLAGGLAGVIGVVLTIAVGTLLFWVVSRLARRRRPPVDQA